LGKLKGIKALKFKIYTAVSPGAKPRRWAVGHRSLVTPKKVLSEFKEDLICLTCSR